MARLLAVLASACAALLLLAACRTPQKRAAELIPDHRATLRALDALTAKDLAAMRPQDDAPLMALVPGDKAPQVAFYWQHDTLEPVVLLPHVVAIRGPRSLVVHGGSFVPGVLGEVGDAYPALQAMTNEGLYFVAVDPDAAPDLDVHDGSAPGVLVGRVVLHPRPGTPPLTWPASFLTRRVAVRFHENVVAGLSEDQARAALAPLVGPVGLVPDQTEPLDETTFLFRATSEDPRLWVDAARRARHLLACDGLAEPDMIRGIVAMEQITVEDQWHLRNKGQFGGVVGADGNVRKAWHGFTEGDPAVVIAIIDKYAVDLAHPALAANVAPGSRDMVTGASPPAPPADGHGTAVAGVAAARSPAANGLRGVAPRCRFVNFAVFNASAVEVANALRRARGLGCRVVNMSFRLLAPGMTQGVDDAIHKTGTTTALYPGAVVVAAVSNELGDNFVADDGDRRIVEHPLVLAVGTSTDYDLWGRCGSGSGVALVAPSGRNAAVATNCALGRAQIATTDALGSNGYNGSGNSCLCSSVPANYANPNFTRCFWGTSAAAPQVAGAAALLVSFRPALTPVQVRWILQRSARRLADGQPYLPDGTGGSRSLTTGYGCLDVFHALEIADSGIALP
jgi:hypothetical protein